MFGGTVVSILTHLSPEFSCTAIVMHFAHATCQKNCGTPGHRRKSAMSEHTRTNGVSMHFLSIADGLKHRHPPPNSAFHQNVIALGF